MAFFFCVCVCVCGGGGGNDEVGVERIIIPPQTVFFGGGEYAVLTLSFRLSILPSAAHQIFKEIHETW